MIGSLRTKQLATRQEYCLVAFFSELCGSPLASLCVLRASVFQFFSLQRALVSLFLVLPIYIQ